MKRFIALSLTALAAPLVAAQTPPDLFVFEGGTKIRADEMNSNFQLLRTELESAFGGLTLTQAQLADLEARIDEASGVIGPEGPRGPAGPQGDVGESLHFTWDGTRLGVKTESAAAYEYADLVGPIGPLGDAGPQGEVGAPGPQGEPGVDLEVTWDGTRLGVKRADVSAFTFVDLRGPQGGQGEQGLPGPIGEAGPKGDVGPLGPLGPEGPEGVGLQFAWDGSRLGVKRAGDVAFAYVDLVGPAGPAGPAGERGAAGPTGVALEFSWNGTKLGVKRADEATFQFVELVGPQGPTGQAGPAGGKGDTGVGLEFVWQNSSLGVKREDGSTYAFQDLRGPEGPQGPQGPSGVSEHFGGPGMAAGGTGDGMCVMGDVWLTASTVGGGTVADGRLLPINSNQAMFSLIGTLYGGDGMTTFALPDLRAVAPRSANGQTLTYVICTQGIYPQRF